VQYRAPPAKRYLLSRSAAGSAAKKLARVIPVQRQLAVADHDVPQPVLERTSNKIMYHVRPKRPLWRCHAPCIKLPWKKARLAANALLVVLLGFVSCNVESVARAADPPTLGVLILHSNQRPTPAGVLIEDNLRTVVPEELRRPVKLYSEYLDDEWSSLEAYGATKAEFLRTKYGRRNIRVIVVMALPALQFATKFRDRIFPGVPVVHIAVSADRLAGTTLPPKVAGVFEDLDPTPTLQLALRLHPDAKRLVVIRGADQWDGMWDKRLRTAAERLRNNLEVEYLSRLPTAEVLRRVRALSQGSIVFTPGYSIDGAGQVSTPRQSVERIVKASAVPVYGMFDTLLGSGIVGGYMTPYRDQAVKAGAMIIASLNGMPLSEGASSFVARTLMVDWRQIRRWGIDEHLLPSGTIVSFREATVWDKY
jgi:ABC-type uncharacterized transport system substrate-binding protein